MAQRSNSNRGNSSRSGDQSMMSHWGEAAKEKPFTTAAAAAGAVAAGVFLWSKRNQISDQISRLSDQISDFTGDFRSGSSSHELALTEGSNESAAIESSREARSRRGLDTGKRTTGSRTTAKARRTTGRAEPQSTVM